VPTTDQHLFGTFILNNETNQLDKMNKNSLNSKLKLKKNNSNQHNDHQNNSLTKYPHHTKKTSPIKKSTIESSSNCAKPSLDDSSSTRKELMPTKTLTAPVASISSNKSLQLVPAPKKLIKPKLPTNNGSTSNVLPRSTSIVLPQSQQNQKNPQKQANLNSINSFVLDPHSNAGYKLASILNSMENYGSIISKSQSLEDLEMANNSGRCVVSQHASQQLSTPQQQPQQSYYHSNYYNNCMQIVGQKNQAQSDSCFHR
jgi:hypothetical protein